MTKRSLLALTCAVMLAGCASIVSGVSQPVSVETRLNGEPIAGAACKLTSNKGTWFLTTPGQVMLHRGYQDLAIQCDKPGLPPSITTAASHVRPIFFGNLLFGGIIGIAVDLGDGAAFDYDDLISIDLGRKVANVEGVLAPIAQPYLATAAVSIAAPAVATVTTPDATPAAAPVPTIAAPAGSAGATVVPSTPVARANARQELRYKISAETYARSQSCAVAPTATLAAVGPGYETYAIPCTRGDTLMARCDFGDCRELK